MSKGLQRSIDRGPYGSVINANEAALEPIKNVTFTINATIAITGVAAAVDAGSTILGALPEGQLLFLGAVVTLDINATGDTSVLNTWAGDFGIGTLVNADLDLADAGDDNLIPQQALLAGGSDKIAATVIANSTVGTEQGLVIDNTAANLDANLNLLIDDNFITDTEVGDFVCVGIITLAFRVLGDD